MFGLRHGAISAEQASQSIITPITYIGNGATQSITGARFQPDLVWIKNRDSTKNHILTDSVRGVNIWVRSDSTTGDSSSVDSLTSFDTDGFSVGTRTDVNNSGEGFVAWCFLKDEEVFDIVGYTGNGANRTIAHNMTVAPEMMLVKSRGTSANWRVFHTGFNGGVTPEDYNIKLNETAAEGNSSFYWNDTAPTDSVFSLGASTDTNASGVNNIAYLFASKVGVSKVGYYTGSSSAEQFIDCGFDPRFVLVKRTNSIGNWSIFDSVRGDDQVIHADTTDAEQSYTFTFEAGGFTVNGNDNSLDDKYTFLAL